MTRPPCYDCDENRDHCGQCGCCGDPWKLPPAADFAAQPDAAPPPDGANAAGVDVRLTAIRGRVEGWFTPSVAIGDITMTASTRRIIGDDLRYLLAELAEARDEVAQVTHERDGWLADCRQLTSLNKQILDISRQLEGECDEARAAVDRLSRDRADMAKTIRALVKPDDGEARAKTDGGEWAVSYGDSDPEAPTNPHAVEWCEIPRCDNEDCGHDRQRRVWLGPIEPVTDDGGAG